MLAARSDLAPPSVAHLTIADATASSQHLHALDPFHLTASRAHSPLPQRLRSPIPATPSYPPPRRLSPLALLLPVASSPMRRSVLQLPHQSCSPRHRHCHLKRPHTSHAPTFHAAPLFAVSTLANDFGAAHSALAPRTVAYPAAAPPCPSSRPLHAAAAQICLSLNSVLSPFRRQTKQQRH